MTTKDRLPIETTENNADLDFLRDKFEHDGLKLPPELSADAILQKLERIPQEPADSTGALDPIVPAAELTAGAGQTEASGLAAAGGESASAAGPFPAAASGAGAQRAPASPPSADPSPEASPKRRPPWRRPLIAVAACAMLAICLIPVLHAIVPDGGDSEPAMTASEDGLYQFTSYDELDRQLKSMVPEQENGSGLFNIFYSQEDVLSDELAAEDAPDADMESAMPDAGATTGNGPAASAGKSASGSDAAGDGDSSLSGNLSGSDGNSDVGSSAKSSAPDSSASSASNDFSANSDAGDSSDTDEKDAPAFAKGQEKGERHSNTYTQVEGIDEADIVKTDGKYIYYVSSVTNQVNIAKASRGKARRVSAVSGSRSGSYISDIYIHGDRLVVIGSDVNGGLKGGDDIWSEASAVTIYDITDCSAPKELTRYSQTGRVLGSRLIGDSVCLITNDTVYSYIKGRNLPFVSYDSSEGVKLPIENISCFPRLSDPSYTVIGLIDLTSGKATKDSVQTRAVLGGSNTIYCSGENLYVTGTLNMSEVTSDTIDVTPDTTDITPEADIISNDADTYLPYAPQWKTQILKVSLSGGKVNYKSSAIVDGTLKNQWAMDERDGTFRVATTAQQNGVDINDLFILDANMKQIGSVLGFAKDEHIEAVRYIGTKAYVITYRQTDPLFIIDLADPTNPVIEGHVKISGFSTLLVPVDKEHLLGLGFSTETNEFGGEATNGVKLALFDTSDPSQPAVADSISFPQIYSEVQYDHKALLAGPDGDYFAIPYEKEQLFTVGEDVDVFVDEEEPDGGADPPAGSDSSGDGSADGDSSGDATTDGTTSNDATADGASDDDPAASLTEESSYGVLVFSAKAGELQIIKNLPFSDAVKRCIYIGDYIYGICSDDSIEGFRIDSRQ